MSARAAAVGEQLPDVTLYVGAENYGKPSEVKLRDIFKGKKGPSRRKLHTRSRHRLMARTIYLIFPEL